MEINARIYGPPPNFPVRVRVLPWLAGVTHTPGGLLSGPYKLLARQGRAAPHLWHAAAGKVKVAPDEPLSQSLARGARAESYPTRTPDGVVLLPSQPWTPKNVASSQAPSLCRSPVTACPFLPPFLFRFN